MRILSMTATFGKLEHQTLTLEPGLNVIEAPNEWGKSTWCAFLIAMLYGVETRVKSTASKLADKEHYAPWSGSPMSGRMDILWNGRNITLERSTKGRQIMGIFRAYETDTGLEIPELTGENCGQTLLGVERSVFTKAGFLRFSDLPVGQEEALRQRLNALVTTGDESGQAEFLQEKLKELKNKCYVNRSKGLIPEGERERQELKKKLDDHDKLTGQLERLRIRQAELEQWLAQLENHKAALRYAAAQEDSRRLREATAAWQTAVAQEQSQAQLCQTLPERQCAEQALAKLEELRQAQESLNMEAQMLPDYPEFPEIPLCFQGKSAEAAMEQVHSDGEICAGLNLPKKPGKWPLILAVAGFAAVVAGLVAKLWPVAAVALVPVALGIILARLQNRRYRTSAAQINARREELCGRYGSDDPAQWLRMARQYRQAMEVYGQEMKRCREIRGDFDRRRAELAQRLQTEDLGSRSHWEWVIATRDQWADACREVGRTRKHLEDLQSMAKTAPAPATPDALTYSEGETNGQISNAGVQLRQLQLQIGQLQGQAEALGDVDALRRELEQVENRLAALEQTRAALELAQETLEAASAELQRRFAPRITSQTQKFFGELTGGRYDSLTLDKDLSLHAAAQGEDTLRSPLWRSDGTVDQLYLALRLAVARELTPEAPLILDDALVRFDDTRLGAALDILRREGEEKQVILFTCQGREKGYL